MDSEKYNNRILTIVPEKVDGSTYGYENKDLQRVAYCYIHGELETINEFDIFYLLVSELKTEDIGAFYVNDTFPVGIFECKAFERDCTFFHWKANESVEGLVVFNDDKEGLAYAENEYNEHVERKDSQVK